MNQFVLRVRLGDVVNLPSARALPNVGTAYLVSSLLEELGRLEIDILQEQYPDLALLLAGIAIGMALLFDQRIIGRQECSELTRDPSDQGRGGSLAIVRLRRGAKGLVRVYWGGAERGSGRSGSVGRRRETTRVRWDRDANCQRASEGPGRDALGRRIRGGHRGASTSVGDGDGGRGAHRGRADIR